MRDTSKQLEEIVEMEDQITLERSEEQKNERTYMGFWIYLMTDLLMFSGLFAAFIVLRKNVYNEAGGAALFNLPFVLVETLFLLTSSFTCGVANLFAQSGKLKTAISLLFATLFLGAGFLTMELYEFSNLLKEGHSFQKSAFLSSYFGLVGTHGIHISIGILWMIILIIYIFKNGLTKSIVRKITLFSLFWHFLDIVWIFIFTIVYLLGAVV